MKARLSSALSTLSASKLSIQVRPVYWQATGPDIRVMRSVWMYNEVSTVDDS